jgi:hypothetical protein
MTGQAMAPVRERDEVVAAQGTQLACSHTGTALVKLHAAHTLVLGLAMALGHIDAWAALARVLSSTHAHKVPVIVLGDGDA